MDTQGSLAWRATCAPGRCPAHTARPGVARKTFSLRMPRCVQTHSSPNNGGQGWSAGHCRQRCVPNRSRDRGNVGNHSAGIRTAVGILQTFGCCCYALDVDTLTWSARLSASRTWFFGRQSACHRRSIRHRGCSGGIESIHTIFRIAQVAPMPGLRLSSSTQRPSSSTLRRNAFRRSSTCAVPSFYCPCDKRL